VSPDNFRAPALLAGLFVATLLVFGAISPAATRAVQAVTSVQQVRVSDRLYFGRSHPGGVVTEAEWALFLADVVTPRFPQGLTVWSADGQWRDNSRRIKREPTFVLEVVHETDASADQSLKEIVAEYRRRFAQESVLWVRDRVDVIVD
jgi:hypothetical protein